MPNRDQSSDLELVSVNKVQQPVHSAIDERSAQLRRVRDEHGRKYPDVTFSLYGSTFPVHCPPPKRYDR